MTGKVELPLNLGKTASEYLDELRKNLELVSIRRYHIQVNEVIYDTVTTGHEQTRVNHCAVIYDENSDFGLLDVIATDQYQQPIVVESKN